MARCACARGADACGVDVEGCLLVALTVPCLFIGDRYWAFVGHRWISIHARQAFTDCKITDRRARPLEIPPAAWNTCEDTHFTTRLLVINRTELLPETPPALAWLADADILAHTAASCCLLLATTSSVAPSSGFCAACCCAYSCCCCRCRQQPLLLLDLLSCCMRHSWCCCFST